jgi:hypothetical protein
MAGSALGNGREGDSTVKTYEVNSDPLVQRLQLASSRQSRIVVDVTDDGSGETIQLSLDVQIADHLWRRLYRVVTDKDPRTVE